MQHNLLIKAKADIDHSSPDVSGLPRQLSDSAYPSNYFPSRSQDPPDLASSIEDPTALDILRYRYHHGANLGSVYVLERWIFPSRFPEEAQGSSELEAVKAWVEKVGAITTKALFEKAWADAVSDEDIRWLIEDAKCNTIRLPIGYYDLPGLLFTHGTPFEPYAYIYSAAWASIRTLISRLRAHSIGVLIDLHALPGGANPHEHSGTNAGTASFFTSQTNRHLGVRCCEFIAREAEAGLNIVGIQIVNEAAWKSEKLYAWYDECIESISSIDASIPVVISDAWNLPQAVEYSLNKNNAYPSTPTCPLLIDTHVYWAFSPADKQKTPQQIIEEVPTQLCALDGREGSIIDRGAVQTIVGEYSCVFSADSWAKEANLSQTEKERLVHSFGAAQSKRYQQRTAGAFFWTWKMDWFGSQTDTTYRYPGGEWGFAAQSDPENRSIIPPPYTRLPHYKVQKLLELARQNRDDRMYNAVNQHVAYWHHLHKDMPAEHWRYEHGWKVGHHDAYVFFQGRMKEAVGQGNKIGSLELWVLKRVRESGFKGNYVWEFEQGLRRGIQDFNGLVGI